MKKLLLLGLAILTLGGLTACTDLEGDPQDQITEEILSSEQSLATLSYLSTGFLDFNNTSPDVSNIMFLSNTDEEEEPTVIEGELDEVNIYIDRLKALIDNGVESFGSVVEEESDNELYTYKLTFTVNEEVYIIYYNIDELTGEMTGIIVIGDVEYEFEVVDNIKQYEHNEEEKNENHAEDNENTNKENNSNGNNSNNENNDDDDDVDTDDDELDTENEEDENDDDEEESESKMTLIATNGEDTIKIVYKTETDGEETETKFYIEKTIDGVTTESTLKISLEEDELVIAISEGEDEYKFKKEIEDGETIYKLQYKVDGVIGMVKIKEIIGEDGEVTYDYFIQEAGKERHTEKQEPKSKGFDEDEEDSEDSEI